MRHILLFIFFCHSAFSINLIYRVSNDDPLSAKEAQAVDNILQTFEWPGAINLFSNQSGSVVDEEKVEQYGKLISPDIDAEENFLQERVKVISPTLKVKWIPQSLWDLTALVCISSNACGDSNLNTFSSRQAVTNFLLKKISLLFPASELSSLRFNNEKQVSILVLSLLHLLRGNENNIDNDLRMALLSEINLIKEQKSSIIAAIIHEQRAQYDNHILLYRATNGIDLFSGGTSMAIDFPVPPESDDEGRAVLGISVSSSIKNLLTMIKKDNLQSMNFSFQYSLFGGCANDVYICPYFYFSVKKSKILYALSLERSFLQLRGKQLLFQPPFNAQTLVNNKLILGHPRFRLVGPFRFRADEVLGGKIFRFNYYKPIKNTLIDDIPEHSDKKFLSFLVEIAKILYQDSLIIAINNSNLGPQEKPLSSIALKRNQYLAWQMLKELLSFDLPRLWKNN